MRVALEVIVDKRAEVIVGLVETEAGESESGDGEQNGEDGAED